MDWLLRLRRAPEQEANRDDSERRCLLLGALLRPKEIAPATLAVCDQGEPVSATDPLALDPLLQMGGCR
jgi:hypothetical protein